MSLFKILRFFLGLILALILLPIILPFVGVPASHFLPPGFVYSKAQGLTTGYVTGKYYHETNNAFNIGGKQYFLNYSFKAPTPAPRGSLVPGPIQLYTGTARIPHSNYSQLTGGQASSYGNQRPNPNQVIPLPGYTVKIKYSKSNPVISGITAPWAAKFYDGRSVSPGSATFGGWMLWIVAVLVLGFIFSMLLAMVMKGEDI